MFLLFCFPPMMQKGQVLKPYWTYFQVQLVHTEECYDIISATDSGEGHRGMKEPCWSLDSGDEVAWGRRGLTLLSGFQSVQNEGSLLDYFVSTKWKLSTRISRVISSSREKHSKPKSSNFQANRPCLTF